MDQNEIWIILAPHNSYLSEAEVFLRNLLQTGRWVRATHRKLMKKTSQMKSKLKKEIDRQKYGRQYNVSSPVTTRNYQNYVKIWDAQCS